jgi:hypothetical protein
MHYPRGLSVGQSKNNVTGKMSDILRGRLNFVAVVWYSAFLASVHPLIF